jgi:hypothetical protein
MGQSCPRAAVNYSRRELRGLVCTSFFPMAALCAVALPFALMIELQLPFSAIHQSQAGILIKARFGSPLS